MNMEECELTSCMEKYFGLNSGRVESCLLLIQLWFMVMPDTETRTSEPLV